MAIQWLQIVRCHRQVLVDLCTEIYTYLAIFDSYFHCYKAVKKIVYGHHMKEYPRIV